MLVRLAHVIYGLATALGLILFIGGTGQAFHTGHMDLIDAGVISGLIVWLFGRLVLYVIAGPSAQMGLEE